MGSFHTHLSEADLVSIVLSGALEKELGRNEKRESILCYALRRQLTKIFYEAREDIPLIQERFCFDAQGAIPYSEEVADAFWILSQAGAITSITGEQGDIARPVAAGPGKDALEEGYISEGNYQRFKDLGKKLEVKRTVSI